MARPPRSTTRAGALIELILGGLLLFAVWLLGEAVVTRTSSNALDRVAYRLLPGDPGATWAHELARLGSARALVVMALVALVLSARRDPRRAAVALFAPILAVLLTEHVAKPLVGHHPGAFGGASYPSGTVTAAAVGFSVLTLCSARRWRLLVGAASFVAVTGVAAAVVTMRWHFATDTLGAAFVALGSSLLLDGGFHLLGSRHAPGAELKRTGAAHARAAA